MWNTKNDLPKLSCTNSQISHGQYENYIIKKMRIELGFNGVRKGLNKNHTYLETKWKIPKMTIKQIWIRTNK